jgi:hypothetical protein
MEYEIKFIEETISTKFLETQMNNYLNWKAHIDKILPKLSTACFAVRRLFHIIIQMV